MLWGKQRDIVLVGLAESDDKEAQMQAFSGLWASLWIAVRGRAALAKLPNGAYEAQGLGAAHERADVKQGLVVVKAIFCVEEFGGEAL